MIGNTDAVKLLNSKREDGVFVATMNANNVGFGLPSISTNEALDFPISGAMSKASSVGLGLALAQPNRKIMVLEVLPASLPWIAFPTSQFRYG